MGKELLFDVLKGNKTNRHAWIPFSGVHSGKLLGYNAIEVLKEEEKLLKSLLEVNKLYSPDGQIVLFDLQIEAEILGCQLKYVDNCAPSVISHILTENDLDDIKLPLPKKSDGRLPLVLNVMRKLKKEIGDKTALIGLICGPFTLASHLRGVDVFMDMYDYPYKVDNLLNYCVEALKEIVLMYKEVGMDMIGVVDPLISQISPQDFEQFMSKPFSKLLEFINSNNLYSGFFVCGDATKNIELMCKTLPHAIFIDENVDIRKAKSITDKYNICIGGNLQLTVTMLHGSQNDNRKAVIDIIDNVDNKERLIIAPGCDMPFDTPIENVIAAAQSVFNYKETKKMISGYEKSLNLDDVSIELVDYSKLTKPLIEVFTLDSATCAACGYMMNAVNELYESNKQLFDVVEYKFTIKENIKRCIEIGVKNLPSLYINGKLAFSSIIPNKETLLKVIKDESDIN